MYISKICIKNFRNFKECCFEFAKPLGFAKGLILVGETQSGKTNFIQALRLILDPSHRAKGQELDEYDFFDPSQEIEIKLYITAEWGHPLAGLLYDCYATAVEGEQAATGCLGLVAKLHHPARHAVLQFFVGERRPEQNMLERLPGDLVSAFQMGYLEPLRDVEKELKSKAGSPLRWAFDALIPEEEDEEHSRYRTKAEELSSSVGRFVSGSTLQTIINSSHRDLMGPRHHSDYAFNSQELELKDALQECKLGFPVQGKHFDISKASLGLNNALYITLKRLTFIHDSFRKPLTEVSCEVATFTWLAIEEPEAHLHPHLQRQMFKSLMEPTEMFSTIVTSHSPHLVSISDPRMLLVLRRLRNGESKGYSFKGKDHEGRILKEEVLQKLKNYLHVTRAEMIFASGILLVEGIAEKNLINAWFPELDGMGISVCNVDNTDFTVYQLLLDDLHIPYAIITDWDPKQQSINNSGTVILGNQNVTVNSYLQTIPDVDLIEYIFTNIEGCTLEWELCQHEVYKNKIQALALLAQPQVGQREFGKLELASQLQFKECFKSLKIQKGMLSQDLASIIILSETELPIPQYIQDAVEYIKRRISMVENE